MNEEQVILILKIGLFILGFAAAIAIGVAVIRHI